MYITPSSNLQVDYYADEDFSRLLVIEYDQDPICVKYRTGYLIEFMNYPLL